MTPQSAYPLLERLLFEKGLSLKGIYTNQDASAMFGVSTRTIQDWVRAGKLRARDLPGHGRFLSEDLECFLQQSASRQHGGHREQTLFGSVYHTASPVYSGTCGPLRVAAGQGH